MSSTWLSSMARLTGATDASGNPLVFDTNVDPTNLANAIVSNIQTSAAKPVNVGFTTSGLPSGLSAFSPNVVDSVAPGSTASTTATIKATGSSRNGAFSINFVDASSGAELGSIPVTVACAAQPSGPIHTTHASNWAGYDAKLKTVTDIHAIGQVPAVSCSGSRKRSEMSMWGGIDDQSNHLVQAGALFISTEEHQRRYRLKCLFDLLDRRTEPAAFLAKHPPGLEMGDGAFDCGADFTESRIESGLGFV